MANYKKTKGEEIGKLVEELAILSESERSDWVVGLAKISWHDKPEQIEIRSYNKTFLKDPEKAGRGFGKGIALSEEALDVLTEELVRLGYGNNNEIKQAYKERPKNKKKKSTESSDEE